MLRLKTLPFIPLILFLSVSALGQQSPNFKYKSLELYGVIQQGAMVQGKVSQARKLTVLEKEIYLDDDGYFVFGLGRDAAKDVLMQVEWENGNQEEIRIPVAQRSYNLQRIEGVDDKYVRELDPETLKRVRAEAAQVWQARQHLRIAADFKEKFRWPAEGPITGVYGSQRIYNGVPKRPHYGLDIAGPVGTPIYAPASGVVRLTHNDMYYSGGTLVIDHGQGISSTFIHLSKILVAENQSVKAGDLIAEMGASGRVTGPHLDWRMNWYDQRLDPQLLLPEKVDKAAQK